MLRLVAGKRHSGKLAAGLVLIATLLMAACGAGPSAEGPASTPTKVFFPKLKQSELTPAVVATGEFLLDDEGCLRVDDDGAKADRGFVPLWTPQYELNTNGGDIRVLDGKNRVVAKVGEEVHMGGGGIDRKTLEEHDFMNERQMRELFERCSRKDYWMVLDGDVNLISQG